MTSTPFSNPQRSPDRRRTPEEPYGFGGDEIVAWVVTIVVSIVLAVPIVWFGAICAWAVDDDAAGVPGMIGAVLVQGPVVALALRAAYVMVRRGRDGRATGRRGARDGAR